MKADNYRQKIAELKSLYLKGEIELSEAKERAQPIIDEMNIKGLDIAKKYGGNYKKLTFAYLFR
jgi:hypothetical protein